MSIFTTDYESVYLVVLRPVRMCSQQPVIIALEDEGELQTNVTLLLLRYTVLHIKAHSFAPKPDSNDNRPDRIHNMIQLAYDDKFAELKGSHPAQIER